MRRSLLISLLLIFSLANAGCGMVALAWRGGISTPAAGGPTSPPPSATRLRVSLLPGAITPTPFQPLPPTPTELPTSTPTLVPIAWPRPTWARQPAGSVEAPILLYHHIDEGDSLYYVSPKAFRRQMESLKEWGYTAISLTRLANVLKDGGRLPPRPVVITFDDGNRDVYENAFPIMKELGFTGVFYLVSGYVNTGGFVRVDELKEMIAAGWEIGDHSATHSILTDGYSAWYVQREVVQSRLDLEKMLGVTINSFSYPYGLSSPALQEQVKEQGYLDAVGVGATWRHSVNAIYFLGRCEVPSYFTLDDFAAMLPWAGRR